MSRIFFLGAIGFAVFLLMGCAGGGSQQVATQSVSKEPMTCEEIDAQIADLQAKIEAKNPEADKPSASGEGGVTTDVMFPGRSLSKADKKLILAYLKQIDKLKEMKSHQHCP